MEYFLRKANNELQTFTGSYSRLSYLRGFAGDIYTAAYATTIFQLYSIGEIPSSFTASCAFDSLRTIKKIDNPKHDLQYTLLHGGSLIANNFAYDGKFADSTAFASNVLDSVPDFNTLLQKLEYRSLWRDSNIVMGVVLLQIASNRFSNDLVTSLFSHLARLNDESNGFWRSKKNPSLINSIAGAFHFLPIYDFCNEPIPCSAELKSAVLKLLNDEAMLCGANGYACIDYDVACILTFLWKHHHDNFSSREVKQIVKFLDGLIANFQSRNSAFSEYGEITNTFRSLASMCHRFSRHRCLLTLAWDIKALYKVVCASRTSINANSIEENCGTPLAPNVFSILFRLMTFDVAFELRKNLIENTISQTRIRMPLPGLGYL